MYCEFTCMYYIFMYYMFCRCYKSNFVSIKANKTQNLVLYWPHTLSLSAPGGVCHSNILHGHGFMCYWPSNIFADTGSCVAGSWNWMDGLDEVTSWRHGSTLVMLLWCCGDDVILLVMLLWCCGDAVVMLLWCYWCDILHGCPG